MPSNDRLTLMVHGVPVYIWRANLWRDAVYKEFGATLYREPVRQKVEPKIVWFVRSGKYRDSALSLKRARAIARRLGLRVFREAVTHREQQRHSGDRLMAAE